LFAPKLPNGVRLSDLTASILCRLQEANMSTTYTEYRIGLAITDLFLSIFGPVLAAGVVLLLAVLLNIL